MAGEDRAFRKRVRAHKFGLWLTARAGRHPPNWIDRWATRTLAKAIGRRKTDADFMRDELVDTDTSFTAEQLAHYPNEDNERF